MVVWYPFDSTTTSWFMINATKVYDTDLVYQ